MKEFVEKLIERLEELKEESIDKWDGGASHKAYIKAIEIVNQMAEEYNSELIEKINFAIEASNTNDNYMTGLRKRWIPVTERLPEYKGEYLITTNFGVTSALYLPQSKKWVDTIEQYFEYSCVAWQPLPEPYKPEQQKEIPVNHYIERFNRVI